jgi:DNA invertase Pin-like site-specific DNA recombinase
MIYGYARVSTTEQETTLQLDALHRAGVVEIVQEKCGGTASRPQLQALIRRLKKGDKVYVWKVDRFARSLRDLLQVLERITLAGATFQSLTEPIDTTTPVGLLMFQMTGAVAEFERSMIRERSIAGQRAAVERGAILGRPRALSKGQEKEAVERYLRPGNRESMRHIAVLYGVDINVIKRAVYRVTKPNSSTLK